MAAVYLAPYIGEATDPIHSVPAYAILTQPETETMKL